MLGEQHPDMATTYNTMAGVFRNQGEYAQALEYYERALAIWRVMLGEQHPDTVTI